MSATATPSVTTTGTLTATGAITATPAVTATGTATATPVVTATATPAVTATATVTDTAPFTLAPPATPAGNADLSALDTESQHYSQQPGDLGNPITLQLYNSPAGVPGENGWSPLDLTLAISPATGLLSPALTPYGLRIAPRAGDSTLATLTVEGGLTLGLGLTGSAATVAGRVSDNAVTYPGIVPSGPATATGDLALRATASGLDAHVTLHSAQGSGPVALTLAPDPRLQLAQDPASGAITATQMITSYAADGVTPYVMTETEYLIQPAVATVSDGSPTSAVDTGAVDMSLGVDASGAHTLALTVDPAWLARHAHDGAIGIDLPIITEDAYSQTGLFGTVNSCAPDVPAPPTGMVVGVAGGCAYNGQAYFDTGALRTPAILSATLHLYTPGHTGATSVRVFPNVGPVAPEAMYQPASWNTALPVLAGAPGIDQSASDGSWQSWDVTDIVRGWATDSGTNGGFTLTNDGTPVRFAASATVGADAPAATPYLEITYGTTGASVSGSGPYRAAAPAAVAAGSGPYQDKAQFIYGVNGNVVACNLPALTCNGAFNMNIVPRGQNNPEPKGPGAQFVRINAVSFQCAAGDRPARYFNATYGLMASVYKLKLIPDVVLDFDVKNNKNSLCNGHQPTKEQWQANSRYFITHMSDAGSALQNAYTSLPPTYFEVGNEPNQGNQDQRVFGGITGYPTPFAYAATGLYQGLNTQGPKGRRLPSYYRILTAGVFDPEGYKGCTSNSNLIVGIDKAVTMAKSMTPKLNGHLGVAVHPYGYTTTNFRDFRVAGGTVSNGTGCRNLGSMNTAWLSRPAFQHLPLVYTEINFDTGGDYGKHGNTQSVYYGKQGNYLVDLFTYLYDTRSQQSDGVSTPSIDPSYDRVRVFWADIADFTVPGGPKIHIGLFEQGGQHKIFFVRRYCSPRLTAYPESRWAWRSLRYTMRTAARCTKPR